MRKRSTLDGHEAAVNWKETMENHEADASMADEVESALDESLERTDNNGGQGAVTIKRAEPFEYGSVGSKPNSTFRMPQLAPGDTSLRPGIGGALQRHGPAQVRLAARNPHSSSQALSHARGVIQQLGNGRKK